MLSVILPTYNRFEIVEETLQKIVTLETNIPFEIIVVNDGQELPFNMQHEKLSIYKNPKKGASAARNFGASKAKYDIFFFIDDDMWITAESLNQILYLNQKEILKNDCALLNWRYPDELIQSMYKNKIGRYLLNANYHTLEGRLGRKLDNNEKLIQLNSIGSGSFVIANHNFNKVGGYNDTILFQGEDIDLSNKLNAQGVKIYLDTKLTCYHNQKDRLDIDGYIDREHRGYTSQFNKTGKTFATHTPLKQFIYTLLIPFNAVFKLLFQLIPNNSIFDFITFKTIGILTSIVYFKAYYNAEK